MALSGTKEAGQMNLAGFLTVAASDPGAGISGPGMGPEGLARAGGEPTGEVSAEDEVVVDQVLVLEDRIVAENDESAGAGLPCHGHCE